MENTNAVLVAGDWHGDIRWAERVIRQARKAGYKTILHVGDLGVLWPSGGGPQTEDKFTRLLKLWLRDDMFLVFCDGNHDVHPRLRALPLNAAGFGVISDRLLYSPRGHRFTLGGKRFGSLGGAVSIDRSMRVPGRSWWPEEAITPEDVERLGNDDPVDILITHEVPAGVHVESGLDYPLAEEVAYETYQQRLLVLDAVKNTRPALVFSGHFHQRVTQRLENSDTTVHVLHMNGYEGNVVSLDLDTMRVTEFPVRPFY